MTSPQQSKTRADDKPLDVFWANREKFPEEELLKYIGQWLAFSADGRTILASAEDLGELDAKLVAAGIDPQDVFFERVPADDDIQHGSELYFE
jgi:hypothetical protein